MIASILTFTLLLAADPKVSSIRDLAKQGAQAIPQIEPFLNDADAQVREEAVKAISEIGSSACLSPLIRATADNDPEVEIHATDGLVNFYLPGYIKTGLTGAVKKAGTAVKSRFAEVNDQVIDGYVEVRPDVVKAIGKVTRNGGSLEARANGARALGILRAKAAIPDLTEALSTKDSTVIYEVLKAFEKIRDPAAAPNFSYLLKDFNEKVQLMAIEASGVLANRQSLPTLREALQNARSIKVQRAALSAIGKIPDPEYRDLFEHYLHDKDADLRGDAAEGFARLKNPKDEEPMVRAYADENKPAAKLGFAFAAVALGRHDLGPDTPLRYLIAQLKSKFYSGVAQGYLIELLRDPSIREGVYPVLRDANKEEKVQLCQIFGVSGDKDTIKYLEVLQADPSVEVRDEAVRGMRTLKARIEH
jgi:HEAT repeat protein